MSEAREAAANTLMRNVLLTERDLALLWDLHANVVMSFWQIHKSHFAGKDHSTVINRLKRLELAGFIERTRIQRMKSWHGGKLLGVVYQITPAGLKTLSKSRELYSERVPTLNLASLEHDLLVNDIRAGILRKFPDGTWINGRFLVGMKGLNKIPDACVKLPEVNKLVAIELELHAKSSVRYREIVSELRSSSALEKVIYVTPHLNIGRKIMSEIAGYEVQPGNGFRDSFFEFVPLTSVNGATEPPKSESVAI